ncbi:hypothetical protein ACHAWT_005251 [Skeletonema menzelii]
MIIPPSRRTAAASNAVFAVLTLFIGCISWIVLSALSSYSLSISDGVAAIDTSAHIRLFPSLYDSDLVDDAAMRSRRNNNDDPLTNTVLEPSNYKWIMTSDDEDSSHRHLSKHLKQLKEQEDSQQPSSIQPVVMDYSQFSCDSMNDPDLLSKLHKRWKKQEQQQQQREKEQRVKKKRKSREENGGDDGDHGRIETQIIEDKVEPVLQSNDKHDAKLQKTAAASSIQQHQQQQHEQTSVPPILLDKCQFAKTCNGGEGVGFGAALFCSRTTISNDAHSASPSSYYATTMLRNTLTILLLVITLLLLFRLLNSTTDEFFSPGLEHFSLQLGLPPRFAGVTLLALGNGAPDVAATMNATLDSQEGYLMALGELTGTSMFVSGVILGVIVGLNDGRGEGTQPTTAATTTTTTTTTKKMGVPCKGPLLRDIAVLTMVCIVSMSYLERGVVDYGFVYTLLAMYFVYVLTVLGADAYHLLYHLPRVRRSESGVSFCSNNGGGGGGGVGVSMIEEGKGWKESCGEGRSQGQGEDEDATTAVDNKEKQLVVANEQTPLVAASSGDSSHHLLHNRHHSLPVHTHSIRDTVIEAMSNYNCNEEHEQEEQIVIFHPHHAVHPHHENGPMFLLNVFRGGDVVMRRGSASGSVSPKASRSRSARQTIRKTVSDGVTSFNSWSSYDATRDKRRSDDISSSSLSSHQEVMRLSSPDRVTTVIPLSSPPFNMTSRSSDEECAQPSIIGSSCDNNDEMNNDSLCCASLQRPKCWEEAWRVNVQEFKEHWNDFFVDIYHNEENGALDVMLLSMELPFTIVRKLTNPVPCDGYYCRPLVGVSIILSPLWLWYYFNDQFGYDFSSTYTGYLFCGSALLVGITVMRYAPGGDGPMDLYMVVPLTLYGFAIAATWLDSIADKLVELLELFGILLEIPSTIMGLTVLAFGNSLQDLIANVSLSRKGLSTMAVTACLAGPIFNLCIGLGLGFMALLKSTGKEEIHVKFPKNIKTGFYFTLANCVLILIAGVFVGKGVLGRGYGYLACGLYLAYVVTSLYV